MNAYSNGLLMIPTLGILSNFNKHKGYTINSRGESLGFYLSSIAKMRSITKG